MTAPTIEERVAALEARHACTHCKECAKEIRVAAIERDGARYVGIAALAPRARTSAIQAMGHLDRVKFFAWLKDNNEPLAVQILATATAANRASWIINTGLVRKVDLEMVEIPHYVRLARSAGEWSRSPIMVTREVGKRLIAAGFGDRVKIGRGELSADGSERDDSFRPISWGYGGGVSDRVTTDALALILEIDAPLADAIRAGTVQVLHATPEEDRAALDGYWRGLDANGIPRPKLPRRKRTTDDADRLPADDFVTE